jgi:putative endonuclease
MEQFASVKSLNRVKGNAGEATACHFLEQNGFQIIQQNYRTKLGEIDIIASRAEQIHFIEVKKRLAEFYGTGRESVTPRKQATIRRVATQYLVEHDLYDQINASFDVVEITGDGEHETIVYLENCF